MTTGSSVVALNSRWRPPPAIWVSLALHLAAVAVVLVDWRFWPWGLAAVVANHAILVIAGLLPRSRVLGPNWIRLPAAAQARHEVAITIDDGPDPEVTPAVLDVLDRYAARATFFCIGDRLERHPALAREIVARGHAIENHSDRHQLYFSLLGPARIGREIEHAQARIEGLTGARPMFFRAPAGLRNFFLDYVLSQMGMHLASWTRRGFDTLNRSPDAVLGALERNLAGGDILLLHDGNCARLASGVPIILEVLPRLLVTLRARGLVPVTLRAAMR